MNVITRLAIVAAISLQAGSRSRPSSRLRAHRCTPARSGRSGGLDQPCRCVEEPRPRHDEGRRPRWRARCVRPGWEAPSAAEGARSSEQRRRGVRARSRRDADRHRGLDRAARTPSARLRRGARRRLVARHLVGQDADSRRGAGRRGRANGHRSLSPSRKTARSSRSSRRRRARRKTISGSTGWKTTAPAVSRRSSSGASECSAASARSRRLPSTMSSATSYYADEVTGIHKWRADPDAPVRESRTRAVRHERLRARPRGHRDLFASRRQRVYRGRRSTSR